jgi:hypothetical protein
MHWGRSRSGGEGVVEGGGGAACRRIGRPDGEPCGEAEEGSRPQHHGRWSPSCSPEREVSLWPPSREGRATTTRGTRQTAQAPAGETRRRGTVGLPSPGYITHGSSAARGAQSGARRLEMARLTGDGGAVARSVAGRGRSARRAAARSAARRGSWGRVGRHGCGCRWM